MLEQEQYYILLIEFETSIGRIDRYECANLEEVYDHLNGWKAVGHRVHTGVIGDYSGYNPHVGQIYTHQRGWVTV